MCVFFVQISYRLFELTNTLKIAFVPSKDNKRLMHNMLTALAVSSVLYSLSFIFLKVPQMLVRVTFDWIVVSCVSVWHAFMWVMCWTESQPYKFWNTWFEVAQMENFWRACVFLHLNGQTNSTNSWCIYSWEKLKSEKMSSIRIELKETASLLLVGLCLQLNYLESDAWLWIQFEACD